MKRIYITIIISLLQINISLFSASPQTLSYQGLLNDNSGNAVTDGSYSITFKIYDVLTGGAALWTETQSVTTKTGIFSAILGASTPINIEFDKQLYLGITVGGSELSPRTTLVSAPYTSNLPKVALVKDIKSNNTNGGTFTSGAWRTRVLNTLTGNTDFISLNANQITLDAGTYIIEAYAPAYKVDRHQANFYNVTDANIELSGTPHMTGSSEAISNMSNILGVVTLNSQKVFEIRHYCTFTRATDGFGHTSGIPSTTHVYTQVKITKISN